MMMVGVVEYLIFDVREYYDAKNQHIEESENMLVQNYHFTR
jgi:hypothetical protein